MQTTGACLLAVNRRSSACVRMPAQDIRSAHGLLYLAAVRTARASKNKVKEPLDLLAHGSKSCPTPSYRGSSWMTWWRIWFRSAPSFTSTCAATPSPSRMRPSRMCSVPM